MPKNKCLLFLCFLTIFKFSVQKQVETLYNELRNLAEERGYRLQESKRFFNFMRDADEVAAWIQDQMVIASSEDYGKDVEHVEVSCYVWLLIPSKIKILFQLLKMLSYYLTKVLY